MIVINKDEIINDLSVAISKIETLKLPIMKDY